MLNTLIVDNAQGATPSSAKKENRASVFSQLIRQRRIARTLALLALYEIDTVQHLPGNVIDGLLQFELPEEDVEELTDERLRVEKLSNDGNAYLRWLVAGTVQHHQLLDELIVKFAPDFPIDQLGIIDRNLLRMALFELGSKSADTPAKVVINEAVELAKFFGSDNTPRFVNGVLGAALASVFRKLF